jgi:hypothetical protein
MATIGNNNNNLYEDSFISDIRSILNDIDKTQEKKRNEINDHFKNIASNPGHSYTPREQVAILLEIMNCYNTNIIEYQKNMRELGVITKNLIRAHNSRAFSDEIHSSREPISSMSLYDYLMQLIWGPSNKKPSVEPGREPSIDLADIFNGNDIIEQTSIEQIKNEVILQDIRPQHIKRRNTIQPISKNIPNL